MTAPGPDDPGPIHERPLLHGKRLGADDPGGRGPARHADDDDDDEQRQTDPEQLRVRAHQLQDDRRQDEREHEGGQHQEEVGDAHEHGVQPAADEPGNDPDDRSEQDGHHGGQQADHHRDARAVDGQVEDVPADLVRAQQVRGAGRVEHAAAARGGRLERAHEQVRSHCQHDEDGQDGEPEQPIGAARESTCKAADRLQAKTQPGPTQIVRLDRRGAQERTRGSSSP